MEEGNKTNKVEHQRGKSRSNYIELDEVGHEEHHCSNPCGSVFSLGRRNNMGDRVAAHVSKEGRCGRCMG